MKLLKKNRQRIWAVLLALVLVLPIIGFVPQLLAEKGSKWDLASYEDQAEVSPEIVERFLQQGVEDFEVTGNLTIDVQIEMGDAEQKSKVPFIMSGDFDFLATTDQEVKLISSMLMNMAGMQEEMSAEVYIVSDPESDDNLLMYSKVLDGSMKEDGTPSVRYTYDNVERANLEDLQMKMTPEEFSTFAKLIELEDKGETIDAMLILSVPKFMEFVEEHAEEAEDYVESLEDQAKEDADDTNEVDDAEVVEETEDYVKSIDDLEELQKELGVTELVMPFEVTLEKETGHLMAMHFDASDLAELLNELMQELSAEDPEMPSMSIQVNDFSLKLDDIQYGVEADIVVPQDILDAKDQIQEVVETDEENEASAVDEAENVAENAAESTTESTENSENKADKKTEIAPQKEVEGVFAFEAPALYDNDNYALLDEDAVNSMIQDLYPEISLQKINSDDEHEAVLLRYTNNSPYPISEYTVTGKSHSTNEELSFYLADGVVMPGETSAYSVQRSYSDEAILESVDDFSLSEIRIAFLDAPDSETCVSYDAKLESIQYASHSDYYAYTTEQLLDPEAYTVELGLNDYDGIDYIIHNNGDKAITWFDMSYKTEDGFPLHIRSSETLLPGDSTSTQSTYPEQDGPWDLASLEPLHLEISTNENGEETRIVYDYGLGLFMTR